MKINELIEKLDNEFDEVEKGSLNPETTFREMDWWSSMHALIIIALVDVEYNVQVSGNDLKSILTVRDLYDIILQKQKNGSN